MKSISEVIRMSLRGSDLFSRFSVSQFIVMLGDATYKNAKMVLERMNNNYIKVVNKNNKIKIKCDINNHSITSNSFPII